MEKPAPSVLYPSCPVDKKSTSSAKISLQHCSGALHSHDLKDIELERPLHCSEGGSEGGGGTASSTVLLPFLEFSFGALWSEDSQDLEVKRA